MAQSPEALSSEDSNLFKVFLDFLKSAKDLMPANSEQDATSWALEMAQRQQSN